MIHATSKTLETFQNDVDRYGDSYTVDSTPTQLKELFSTMDIDVKKCNVRKLENRIFGSYVLNIFAPRIIYLDYFNPIKYM